MNMDIQYALKKGVNNKNRFYSIYFNLGWAEVFVDIFLQVKLTNILIFIGLKIKVKMWAAIASTRHIYNLIIQYCDTQIQQYLRLDWFNILVMFWPAILHRGLTSALRGLCVSAWCNRETLSDIDRQGLREPPSVPQPLCLWYWSPYVYVCVHVRVSLSFFFWQTHFFLCDVYHGTSSIISQRGSGGGPLALICCVIGHWIWHSAEWNIRASLIRCEGY